MQLIFNPGIFVRRSFFVCLNTALLLGAITANAQQPGGVSGTRAWFKTDYDSVAKRARWKDYSGNNFIIAPNSFDFNNLNYNNSAEFEGTGNSISLPDIKFDQATFIGMFYPNYEGQFEDNDFYKVKFNDQDIFTIDAASITQKTSFDYQPDFKEVKNEDWGTAMKPLTWYRYKKSFAPSVWGEYKRSSFTFKFKGELPEFIIYNRILTPGERLKVETYLAIKYGTTLDTSYLGSSGRIIWNINTNRLYHHRVCAIGRDSLAAIWQPKSNSSYEEVIPSYPLNSTGEDDKSYYNARSSDLKIIGFLPDTDRTSIFRSLTIGFEDKKMRGLADGQFTFWGDDNGDINKRAEADAAFPGLIVPKRNWLIVQAAKDSQFLKLEVSGTLYRSFYNYFDYQKVEYVLVKWKNDLKSIDTTYLFSYLARQVYAGDFLNDRLAWHNIDFKANAGVYFTVGIVPKLKIAAFNENDKQLYYLPGQPIFPISPQNGVISVSVLQSKNYGLELKFEGGVKPFVYSFQKSGVQAVPVALVDNQTGIPEKNLEDKAVYTIVITDKVGQKATKTIRINWINDLQNNNNGRSSKKNKADDNN